MSKMSKIVIDQSMKFRAKRGLWAIFLLVLFLVSTSSASDLEEEYVRANHLSKEEASSLVKEIFRGKKVSVIGIRQSPIVGLWELILEREAGKGILYIDFSKTYFLGGPIFTIHGLQNKTKESLLAHVDMKPDFSQIPLGDALTLGHGNARKRVIVFLSPLCPACREMLKTMKDIAIHRKDILFYLKMLPESREDDSFWMSETIVSQRSLELLEDGLAGYPIPRPKSPVPQVAQTMALADGFGITSTPAMVLADGTVVEGALSRETLLKWIEYD